MTDQIQTAPVDLVSEQARRTQPTPKRPAWRLAIDIAFLAAAATAAWYSLDARLNVLRPDRLLPTDEAIPADVAKAREKLWNETPIKPEQIEFEHAIRLLRDMGVDRFGIEKAAQFVRADQLQFDMIALRDSGRRDGDAVLVEAGPLRAQVPLQTVATMVAVPRGYSIRITAIDEGNAPQVTLSVNNVDAPLLPKGSSVSIGGK